MKPPQKSYFLFRTRREADLRFYEGYDPNFLFRKADLLFFTYMRREEFKTFAESLNGPITDLTDAYFHGVAAELHCTALQQFESLFALMLAAFQPLPHWIYLTRYRTAEIKEKAAAYVAGDIDTASGGQCSSTDQFVSRAIYPGVQPPPTTDSHNESWRTSLADLNWFIIHMASHYLNSPEYNAYKHGLRVLPGSAKLLVDVSGGAKQFSPVLSMKHALSFLEIKEDNGRYVTQEITKEINPEDAYQNMLVMATLLETIQKIRLAGLNGERVEVPLISIEQSGLARLRPVGRFAFPL